MSCALGTRFCQAAAVRAFAFHGEKQSIEELDYMRLMNDLDIVQVAERGMPAVGITGEPTREAGIAGLLCLAREHVGFAEAGRAAAGMNAGGVAASEQVQIVRRWQAGQPSPLKSGFISTRVR